MTTHHGFDARGDGVSARAMMALEAELAIPADLEERMLAAIPPSIGLGSDAAEARDNEALPVRPRSRRRLGAALAIALAAALAVVAIAPARSWIAARREEQAAIARDRAAESAAAVVAAIDWNDGGAFRPKMAALEELRRQISGPASREATARLAPRYVEGVRRAFLDVAKDRLEESLRRVDGADASGARATLKEYLLMSDATGLHQGGAWEASALTATSAEAMASRTTLSPTELQATIRPHVVAWIFLVETEVVAGASIDPELVAHARAALGGAE